MIWTITNPKITYTITKAANLKCEPYSAVDLHTLPFLPGLLLVLELSWVAGEGVTDHVAVFRGLGVNVVFQVIRQMVLQIPDIPVVNFVMNVRVSRFDCVSVHCAGTR